MDQPTDLVLTTNFLCRSMLVLFSFFSYAGLSLSAWRLCLDPGGVIWTRYVFRQLNWQKLCPFMMNKYRPSMIIMIIGKILINVNRRIVKKKLESIFQPSFLFSAWITSVVFSASVLYRAPPGIYFLLLLHSLSIPFVFVWWDFCSTVFHLTKWLNL